MTEEAQEINLTRLVDRLIAECVRANLPPMPVVIAETVARVFARGGSRTEFAVCFSQILILTRARVDALAGAASRRALNS